MVANKIFKTNITQKIIADLDTILQFIDKYELIYDYYSNYLEY